MNVSKYYRNLLRIKRNYLNKKKLENHDFTIISMNCIGGVIYHELNEEFRTPTVNLWMEPHDYIKFVQNLKEYIEAEVEQIESDHDYPMGLLKDIKIHFMHYSDFQTAKRKWDERKARINWNNLYFMMVQCEGCTKEIVELFEKLPYKNKVIFTTEEYSNISCAVHIQGTVNEKNEIIDLCQYKGKFTGKRWIDEFDYVTFLKR